MNVTYSKEIVSDAQALRLIKACNQQINALAVYTSRTNNSEVWNLLTECWVPLYAAEKILEND